MSATTLDQYVIQNQEEYIAQCELEGLDVVLPKENELFIDIDSNSQYTQFVDAYLCLMRNFPGATVTRDTRSRRKKEGRHIVVTMPFDMTATERVAFQAALQSDPVRELLSLLRIRTGGGLIPTLFVEKKGVI